MAISYDGDSKPRKKDYQYYDDAILGTRRDITDSILKLFDWLKPKSEAPKALVPISVRFTDDEQKAMSRAAERFNTVLKNDAPEGAQIFTAPKVADALSAQGLTEYVKDLQREIQKSDSAAVTKNLVDRAVEAQAKAYALHKLPIYLFQIAKIYEGAGNKAKSQEFSQLFHNAQSDFEADQIDKIFLELMETVEKLMDEGFDTTTLKDELNRVILAKQLYDSGFLCFSQI